MSNSRVLISLLAARDGSESALADLLEYFRPLLLSQARNALPAQLSGKVAPSSIVQQTCIDAMRGIQALRAESEAQCRAWLVNILESNVADAKRRYLGAEKRDVGRELSLSSGTHPLLAKLIGHEAAPDAAALSREEEELLRFAMDRLSAHYRQLIEWHHYEHRTFTEIGNRLDKSPDAVRMMYNRAIRQLAREISENEPR